MSTAGKVLSVVVALLAAVWVLLAAGVTQLNRNGTKAVEALKTQITQVEGQVVKARRDIATLTDQAYLLRLQNQNTLAALHAAQTEKEKARSQVLEIATRVKLQSDNVKATLEASKADNENRLAEREAETKAKAEAEALVEKLKAENGEKLATLTSLRDKFRAALQANKENVRKIRQAGASNTTALDDAIGRPATPRLIGDIGDY